MAIFVPMVPEKYQNQTRHEISELLEQIYLFKTFHTIRKIKPITSNRDRSDDPNIISFDLEELMSKEFQKPIA